MVENVIQINSGITVNVGASLRVLKYYICNPATCSCEKDKYLASIVDDSVITFNEIIDAVAKCYEEETRTIPTNEKNIICEKNVNFTYLFINY